MESGLDVTDVVVIGAVIAIAIMWFRKSRKR